MKTTKRLMGIIGSKGLMLLANAAWALPQPIPNGVLTGPLNANGQQVTNVASVRFVDGTTLSTASGMGSNTNAAVTISNAPNAAVVLSGTGQSGNPLTATYDPPIGALLYDEAGALPGILLFDP